MYPYRAGYYAATQRTSQSHILVWRDVYDIALSEKSKLQRIEIDDSTYMHRGL